MATTPLGGTVFRQVMGHFATGVAVVTTRLGDTMHGMTANALTSLSLDPLLVLVCVDHRARTKPLLDAAGIFAINLLAEDQVEVARLFASREVDVNERLRRISYHVAVTGAPIIDGCLAYLDCRVATTYPGGDHTIYVGEVAAAGLDRSEARPLLFYRGGYRGIADA